MGCDEVCTICSEEELAMMKSVSVWKQELAGGLAIVLASHEPTLLEAIGARQLRLGA